MQVYPMFEFDKTYPMFTPLSPAVVVSSNFA